MRTSGIFLFSASVMLMGCAHTDGASPPLFTAFKQFCADTHTVPDAVEEAVEAAGGTVHASGSMTEPYPMEVTSWKVVVQGRDMIVSTGTARTPKKLGKVQDTADCTVVSLNWENSSVAALDAWAGVPAFTIPGTSQTVSYYYYRDEGGNRVPIDAKDADGTVHWMMTVRRTGESGSVQLTRFSASVAAQPD
jgi:hypothetical protein